MLTRTGIATVTGDGLHCGSAPLTLVKMAVGQLDRNVRFVAWENVPERPEFDLGALRQRLGALDADDWLLFDNDMTTGAITYREQDPLCVRHFRIREAGDLPSRLDAARTAW